MMDNVDAWTIVIGFVFSLLAARIAFLVGRQWSYLNIFQSPTMCSVGFLYPWRRLFFFYLPVLMLVGVIIGIVPSLWYAAAGIIIVYIGFYLGNFSAFRRVAKMIEVKLRQEDFQGDAFVEATNRAKAIVAMSNYR